MAKEKLFLLSQLKQNTIALFGVDGYVFAAAAKGLPDKPISVAEMRGRIEKFLKATKTT